MERSKQKSNEADRSRGVLGPAGLTGSSLVLGAVLAAACSSTAPGTPAGGSGSASGGSSASGSGGASMTSGTSTGGGGNGVPCTPDAPTGPIVPAAFLASCSGCHSAYGAAANPAVPDLFTSTDTLGAFTMQVRQGKGLMPAFTSAVISDADIEKVYDYFKAGVPGSQPTCSNPDGTHTTALGCSGKSITYAPLFAAATTSLDPIARVDPTTKHIIFRGAGRVRFRHEMEETFGAFHDHYFEGRTFGYILDDSIAAGGTTIDITFLPDSNQYYSKQAKAPGQEGGADLNIRAWKIYGGADGNAFATNAGGAANNVLPFGCLDDPNSPSCNTRKYTYTLAHNDRENRAMQVGDQLQIEFGIFMARYGSGDGPPVDMTHVRNILPLKPGCTLDGPPYDNNCYTQANYYSDSLRYVVGKGMLTPYNQDCTMSVPAAMEGDFPHPFDCSANGPVAKAITAGKFPDRTGPDEAGWSGGSSTLPYLRQRHDLYYSQMSPSVQQENAESFVQGRRLFHTDFTTGHHIEVNNDLTPAEYAAHADLAGPLYNQVTCEGCHSHNNRGAPPAAGVPFDSVVVKLFGPGKDEHGGPLPDPSYGRQLQDKSLGGAPAEGTASFTYQTISGQFGDGTPFTLTRPTTKFAGMSAGNPTRYSTRLARPLIGMGLLEAIPEADLLAHADPTDCDGDGISGVPNLVFDPEDGKMHLGRFGWKASKASVVHQVAEALNFDLGVTTSVFPEHDCGPSQTACLAADAPQPELHAGDLNLLVTYMRDLAVPPRRDLHDPLVVKGEALFTSLGCGSCHAPNQHTGDTDPFLELRGQSIHPYTDLLLHDLGPDLADDSGDGEVAASPSEWRTPPLWGIGLCDEVAAGYQKDATFNPAPDQGPCHYLHDGRAAHLLDAVLWHGGEAQIIRDKVVALPGSDRDALVAFLKSL
jgi:CxxC motif-containing protein (DUF1111 family)/mono/diheme cytochrome c family protein